MIGKINSRKAKLSDAAKMAEIFNETIDGGGHSPQVCKTQSHEMAATLAKWLKNGWPVRVFLHEEEVVAWTCIHPIVWGGEICHRTGDFSIYVARAWYGRGIALQAILTAFQEARQYGYESVSTWILSANTKSRMLARACRLQLWGLLPKAAHYGDDMYDVEIWGGSFEDAAWVSYMNKLRARIERRIEYKSKAGVCCDSNIELSST